MNAPRIAGIVVFIGLLLLVPVWMFLTMLGGNGMSTRQGDWLLGIVGGVLLVELVAGPWLAARLARHWQARLGPAPAAVVAVFAAAAVLLLGLGVVTFLAFAILAG